MLISTSEQCADAGREHAHWTELVRRQIAAERRAEIRAEHRARWLAAKGHQ
jgi:hypothetical protein